MWNAALDDYVKVFRYDNNGFFTKPYNTTWEYYKENSYCHSFDFLDIEVTDVEESRANLPIGTPVIYAPHNDETWSGCFVFIEEYDYELIKNILFFKIEHKLNVALMNREEKIWVRNVNHNGTIIYLYAERGGYYIDYRREHDWVLMTVDNYLKRLRLYKANFPGKTIPEELTEAFLMKNQVESLIPDPSSYKYKGMTEFLSNCLGRFVRSKK